MRITINLRHTGRVYVGASVQDFATLALMLKTADASQRLCPFPKHHREGAVRILKALDQFAKEVKTKSQL